MAEQKKRSCATLVQAANASGGSAAVAAVAKAHRMHERRLHVFHLKALAPTHDALEQENKHDVDCTGAERRAHVAERRLRPDELGRVLLHDVTKAITC